MPTSRDPGRPERTGWWLAALAVPAVCCVGPGLLAALGTGSLGAGFAAATGRILLAAALVLAVGTLAVAVLRSRRRPPPAGPGPTGTFRAPRGPEVDSRQAGTHRQDGHGPGAS